MATRLLLAELAQAYEQRTGQAVHIKSVGGVDAARRVEAGEAFDVVFLASDAIERLVASGAVVAAGRVDLVRSGLAVAVPEGAPMPDLSSADAVKAAVLAAHRVGVSTGPSGAAIRRLFERWGVLDTLSDRLVTPPPGVPVGEAVARGEVALGFQQFSELVHIKGLTVVGPLPPEIQITTVFSGAVCRASQRGQVVQALLAFMASPVCDEAKRREGMEPA